MELTKVFEEKMSGAKENRPVLTECIEYCITNKVHTLCVSEISRLGRSTKIVVNTLDELTKAGVNVYIQNLPLCTLNSGRELAKAKGVKMGKSIRDTAKLCDVSISTVQRVKIEFAL